VPTIELTEDEAQSLLSLANLIKKHGQASVIQGCYHGELVVSLAARLPQPIVVGAWVTDPDGDTGEVIAIHDVFAVVVYTFTPHPYIYDLDDLEVVA
jgi:hypothetical protein